MHEAIGPLNDGRDGERRGAAARGVDGQEDVLCVLRGVARAVVDLGRLAGHHVLDVAGGEGLLGAVRRDAQGLTEEHRLRAKMFTCGMQQSNLQRVTMGVVYKLSFPSGKVYVGQTIGSARKRWTRHRWQAEQTARPEYHHIVHKAIRKYGWDSVEKTVLASVPNDKLDDEEKRQITLHNCITPNGYNSREGGTFGSDCPETIRQKMRDAYTDERRSKLSSDRLAYIAEHRSDISEASLKMWSGRTNEERVQHGKSTSLGIQIADARRTDEEKAAKNSRITERNQQARDGMTVDQVNTMLKESWSESSRLKRYQTVLKNREEKLAKMPIEQREKQRKLWERKERERYRRTNRPMLTGSSASSLRTTSTCNESSDESE